MQTTILIVDDEPAVTDLLEYNLKKAGYAVLTASDGLQALQTARTSQVDMILLDVMIPEMDGLDVCRELRKSCATPIIIITARGEEVDRVVGLELGADDYICKPFSIRELLARIKAVLRRSQLREDSRKESAVIYGPAGLVINTETRAVTVAGTPVTLTKLEFDVLTALCRAAGRVLTREYLLEQVWGYDFTGGDRAVDSTVKRLRARLRAVSPEADGIETVRGLGYRMAK
ncbi:MAG: response regulator transcription factor [Chloroflexi bacterium]|nr:response regulator transcription factor [Chloroflexota bacterium]